MGGEYNPWAYALGDSTMVWDGELKRVQMALEGESQTGQEEETVEIAAETVPAWALALHPCCQCH